MTNNGVVLLANYCSDRKPFVVTQGDITHAFRTVLVDSLADVVYRDNLQHCENLLRTFSEYLLQD